MQIKLSETSAKKLLFEGNVSGCSSEEFKENCPVKKTYVPLYKRVAGRKDNTVFVPKAKNLYSAENFIKNLNLNKQIVICEEQEKKWSKQLSRMIESIHADLETDLNKDESSKKVSAEDMTFEQMLMSDNFFSFEAFSQCKKLSEMRQKRGKGNVVPSYREMRQMAMKSTQSDSDFEFGKFDIDAEQHDSDYVSSRKLTMDNPVAKAQTSDEERPHVNLKKPLEEVKVQQEELRQEHFYERSNTLNVPKASEVPVGDLFDF